MFSYANKFAVRVGRFMLCYPKKATIIGGLYNRITTFLLGREEKLQAYSKSLPMSRRKYLSVKEILRAASIDLFRASPRVCP